MAQGSGTGNQLEGQNAIIVGGAGAIGSAVAAQLLRDGACVTLMDMSAQKLETVVANLSAANPSCANRIKTHVGNGLDDGDIQAAVALAAGKNKQLDIAIGIVGGCPPSAPPMPLALTDKNAFADTVTYNLVSTFLLTQHAAKIMMTRKSGAIVVVSSIAAIMSAPLMGAYAAGKAALDMMIRTHADELGSFGIRINGVRPGFTLTQTTSEAFLNSTYVQTYLDQQPLKTTGTPEYVASAIRFFAGPESCWITGQHLNVDGGLTLHRVPKREGTAWGKEIPTEWRAYLG
jgi:NAD(P)-dependent dehydrogenase (short-subunit alcohol dehydrogenase family)